MSLTAVFFDVGNTLIFASPELTLAPLTARGIHPTQKQLYAAEAAAKRYLDEAQAKHHSVDRTYWDTYYTDLLLQLQCDDATLKQQLIAAAQTSGNWRRVPENTREVLLHLKRRFRLGIISNSDGGIQRLLETVGLADCFESFTDSRLVGHEKPDPRIFRAALASLQVTAELSVYVGDIYSVDYVGARSAGMQAVLMDTAGAYNHRQIARIASLEKLEPMLRDLGAGPAS